MEINERIKNRRLELGMSLAEVGKACGVSKTTIFKYETSAIKSMSSDVLIPLSKALRTNPLYLLGVVDDPRPIKLEYVEDNEWDSVVGTRDFSTDEMAQLMDFAKYLISKRN